MGKDIFIFENHDEAYFIWKQAACKNETLIHIDAHPDFNWIDKKTTQELLHIETLEELKKTFQDHTPFNFNPDAQAKRGVHIGNYIYPAMAEGLVKTFYWALPDPIWNGRERTLIKKDLLHNFKKYHKRFWDYEDRKELLRFSWEDKEMFVTGFANLPSFNKPVLLDIDVDFFTTTTAFALESKEKMENRFPWIWPKNLAKKIQEILKPKITTIAYSVEGGFTPLSFKFLGDELKEILSEAKNLEDPFFEFRREGIVSQARHLLLKALSLRPQDASIAWLLAESFWQGGLIEDSKKYHQLAVQWDPSYRSEYNNHGIRLEMAGNKKEALKEFEKIILRDPFDCKAKCNAATLHVFYKRHDLGLKLFEEALALDPTCAQAHLGLGFLWRVKKNWEKAQQSFEKAIAHDCDNKSVYYWQGVVFEKLQKRNEAIQHYNQFIRFGRHNIWVGLRLARLYWQRGALYKANGEIERLFRVLKRTLEEWVEKLNWHGRKFLWQMK